MKQQDGQTVQICSQCHCMYNFRCYNCASRIADELVSDGCIAVGNEHGACMDRGCRWCRVYYDGPEALDEMG